MQILPALLLGQRPRHPRADQLQRVSAMDDEDTDETIRAAGDDVTAVDSEDSLGCTLGMA
ncbi:MAG: hypothetical protein R3293_24945 [Candidatus Promineifilaceae bacterium]|nr:hypothetical protein [Candidatus Promineifilaceae bacterium]